MKLRKREPIKLSGNYFWIVKIWQSWGRVGTLSEKYPFKTFIKEVFLKNIFYMIIYWKYILKLQKNVNFEILANFPYPFFAKQKISGLGKIIKESGPADCPR